MVFTLQTYTVFILVLIKYVIKYVSVNFVYGQLSFTVKHTVMQGFIRNTLNESHSVCMVLLQIQKGLISRQ